MKVLTGVDGSAHGFEAVRQAGRLLDAASDQVVLYYTPPELHAKGISADIATRARTALAEAIFAEAKAQLPAELRPGMETIVGKRNAREGLLLAADESKADLIATGARGSGMMERVLMGSVSTAVTRGAHVPVLIARQSTSGPIEEPLRVLLAWDGSPSSVAATKFCCRLKWPAGTVVMAAAVVEGMLVCAVPAWLEERARSADAEAMAQAWAKEHEEEIAQKKTELATYCESLSGAFQSAKPLVAEGHPAEQLLRIINDERISLVVVGAQGMNAIERLVIGSTAERVIRHAPCSVLMVRHHPQP